jgi:erythromycin esterase
VITRWLRDNAHPLRTLDPADDDLSDLEPLRDIVGDARVVAIGESTHRIHEFYQLRHRLTRFLVRELGFTAFVMESGFPEGLAVHDWVLGGPGDPADLLDRGVTYHMGKCVELRDHLEWLRANRVRFYGMDVSDSSASARPAVDACLAFLDDADRAYAESLRRELAPLFGYLPADRTGLAWAAPALGAYLALDPHVRNELTARIGALAERMQAQRVVYSAAGRERYETALRCAATARHTDAFLQAMAAAPHRTYAGANIRDAAMAENVEWILGREERIVVTAANGHVQRWPFSIPLLMPAGMTTLGEHLAASLGERMVVIASAFGGGTLFLHRPVPDGPPGHTEVFTQDLDSPDPGSLDALLATAGLPRYLLDLRAVPATGPVADAFAAPATIMTGLQPTPVDPMAAFDAVVYVDKVSPWHTVVGRSAPPGTARP